MDSSCLGRCRSKKSVLITWMLLLALIPLSQRAYAQTTDPGIVGQWSAVQTWPDVAIHSALLPTGKVLFYPYSDNIYLWDPVTATITKAPSTGYNLWCSGLSFLPDGRLFVAGGTAGNPVGIPQVNVYNSTTNTWSALPNMNAGRWYPTNVSLGTGETLVLSGSQDANYTNNALPQVWTGTAWRNLTSAVKTLPLYPVMFLAPNGKAFLAGPDYATFYLDTSGTGAWTRQANHVLLSSRSYGPAVMYADGKILCVGGGDPPTATAEVIDLTAPTPAWRSVGSMSIARRQHNATLLPDGTVLVTGGSNASGFNNETGAVLYAELWDPATEQFTSMASYSHYRGYHSTALLLPDGRVLSAGGQNTAGIGDPSAEVYSPPYLFKGARPTITAAPSAVGYGMTFPVITPDGPNISQVTWVRLCAVTHTNNMEQRINRLSFVPVAGGLNVTTPTNPNLCQPGYYLLFLLNNMGVPSVAKFIQILPSPSAPSLLTATAPIGAVGRNQINLAWADNATNETGFTIERSTNGTTFTQIATVGANVTTYINTGLKRKATYYYRVYAYNAGGNSAYSNTASARTH